MIEEFCNKLKRRREELNLSLKEVVEKTKIHPSIIKDIEAGNLDKLSLVYLKGFLRMYAAFLGVELDEEVKDYISARQASSVNKYKVESEVVKENLSESGLEEPKLKIPSFDFSNIDKEKLFRAVIILAGVVVLFFIIKGVFFSKHKTPLAKKPSVSANKAGGVGKSRLRPHTQAISKTAVSSKSFKKSTITVKAKRKCFLKVKVNGDVVFEGILLRGVAETWQGKEIEMQISDGSAIEIEVNGRLIGAITRIRKPIKSFKITPSGISVTK